MNVVKLLDGQPPREGVHAGCSRAPMIVINRDEGGTFPHRAAGEHLLPMVEHLVARGG